MVLLSQITFIIEFKTMKIENIEKLKGWTPPGNPTIYPIVTDVGMDIYNYTFSIRYQGISYKAIVRREYESSEFGNRYRIAFSSYRDTNSVSPQTWNTWINIDIVKHMPIFYDTLHTMLHRIMRGKFWDHYGIN